MRPVLPGQHEQDTTAAAEAAPGPTQFSEKRLLLIQQQQCTQQLDVKPEQRASRSSVSGVQYSSLRNPSSTSGSHIQAIGAFRDTPSSFPGGLENTKAYRDLTLPGFSTAEVPARLNLTHVATADPASGKG